MGKVPAEKVDFIKDLKWNLEDASYKPPEETVQWDRVQETLIEHIPDPTEDWEFEVLSIFTTKTVGQLRKAFKK